MLIVQVCDFGNDGDAHYRLHDPSRHLGRLPGVTAIDCHFAHHRLPELAELADVVVLQFVNDWDFLSLCLRRRSLGKVTVFEANDYFFDLQPWSPIAAGWRDRTVQELYLQLMAAADGVQTSADELARRWRERGAKNVAVFANHMSDVAPLPSVPSRPLTIGWAGSPGHFADWYAVAPYLRQWLEAHRDVHLAVMTNDLAKPFFDLPPERYRFANFGSLTDYLGFLRTIDVGIAPLLPTGYNRCRSDVKFLEYASQGVAGVYADLEPYRQSVVPGETGFLFRTPGELLERLDRLRTDVSLRLKIRQQGYDYVSKRRRLPDHIGQRLDWYRSLMKMPASTPLPAEIARLAERDGNYLRLVPREPERMLQEALSLKTPQDAAAKLGRLVAEQPRYLAAWQNRGRLLNDQNDHRGALAALERARELAPSSARTCSEIGRSWFRLGDHQRALASLQEAVRLAPHDLPAWQYLLRLLALLKHPEGPRWAAAALERFPACYSIALLGVATSPPNQAARVLLPILERYAPTITTAERAEATAAFRDAALSTIAAAPIADSVALLRRACEFFPESAKLAAAYGSVLLAAGEMDEGYRQHARALHLHRQADFIRKETPQTDDPHYLFQFAEHIDSVGQAFQPDGTRDPRHSPSDPVAQARRELSTREDVRLESLTYDVAPARNEAYRLYQAGDAANAEAICRKILERHPTHADSHYLLGAIALDASRVQQACDLFRETNRLAPDNAVYANALGEVLLTLGHRAEASDWFRRATEANPSYERAFNNLGRHAHLEGDLSAAQEHFAEAVRLNPNYAIAHNNLGAALQAQSKLDQAAAQFHKALAIRPNYPEAHFNLGTIRQSMGDPVEAAGRFQEALRLRPTYGRAHFHLGQVLEVMRRGPDALACYETAAKFLPEDSEVQRRMGDLLMLKPDWPAAVAALEKSVSLKPTDPDNFARLAFARIMVSDWRTYDADAERLWIDASKQMAAGDSAGVVPFHALTLPWGRDRLLAIAKNHSDAVARHHRQWLKGDLRRPRAADPKRRLRVGYLSGDFYDHPIGHLLYGMFGQHDRGRVEVFAYSFSPPDDSVYRQRIAKECEHFLDIASLSVGDLAKRIADDEIDVLVDLMGHTGIHRLSTLALRPAPIQVSFLGMLGTMGADFIDYVIGDRWVTPPEFAADFTEKIVTMPHAYLIAQPEPGASSQSVRRTDHGLPENGFVFCSFNSPYKLEPSMFAAWMRILTKTPGSVLWLYASGELQESNLRREAASHGVDPARLVFASFVPRPAHLARHSAADLFLDTRYYNAAATASLALQTGLPVLACQGETFGSRVGVSLLNAVGLPEMIASDLAEYERMAVELAARPDRLRETRKKLAANLPTAPLFDTRRFVRNLERAFRTMAEIRDAGRSPEAFRVIER